MPIESDLAGGASSSSSSSVASGGKIFVPFRHFCSTFCWCLFLRGAISSGVVNTREVWQLKWAKEKPLQRISRIPCRRTHSGSGVNATITCLFILHFSLLFQLPKMRIKCNWTEVHEFNNLCLISNANLGLDREQLSLPSLPLRRPTDGALTFSLSEQKNWLTIRIFLNYLPQIIASMSLTQQQQQRI